MAVDFDSLVLAPNMLTFAVPVTVTPTVSQPLAAPYPAVGIFAMQDIDVMMSDGTRITSSTITLGIQLSQFSVIPAGQDTVTLMQNVGSVVAGIYLIDAVRPDGQGGAKLILKATVPLLSIAQQAPFA